MCGIAGYIGPNLLDKLTIENCLTSMSNRGPDSKGYTLNRFGTYNIYLFHTRLSIIDLSKKSNQPITNNFGSLVYNGEIYNFKELINDNKQYQESSDTIFLFKFLLNSKNIVKDLNNLDGMWSFAFFDKKNIKLHLSRDRFGEKPLYVLQKHNEIYFGSEIKQIFSLLNKKQDINFNKIYEYLVYGYKSLYKKNTTFYKNIKRVEPGSVLTINKKLNFIEKKYWKFNSYNTQNKKIFDANFKTIKNSLFQSIERRLLSDVPLCYSLSGGIDSNTLVAITVKEFGIKPHTFSIINSDKRYNEESMINLSTKHLKIKNTKVKINNKNFINNLTELIKYHDKPISTISFYLQSQLYKSVKKNNFKVIINGAAADEIFTGYYDHYLAYLYQIQKNKFLFNNEKNYWKKNVKPFIRNPYLKKYNYFIDNKNRRDHIYLNSEFFSKFLNNFNFSKFKEKNFTKDLLRKRMLNELFHEITPVILDEDDLNAMSYSIENRSPYLSKDLVEKIFQVPTNQLIQNGYTKYFLRKISSEYLPQELIFNYKKVGFNTSLLDLINFNDKSTKEYILSDSPIYEIVNKNMISKMIKKNKLFNSESKFLFNFINAKIFLENN